MAKKSDSYNKTRNKYAESFTTLEKKEYPPITDDNYYKREAMTSDFSQAGYIFSRPSSYRQFRRYLQNPVQRFLTSVSGSNAENHLLLEYLKKKINIQLDREDKFIKEAGSLFIQTTGNLENDKNEILKVFRSENRTTTNIFSKLQIEKFALYLANRYFNEQDKEAFKNVKISDKMKQKYDKIIQEMASGKYVSTEELSMMYRVIIGMANNDPVINQYINESKDLFSFLLHSGKGYIKEVITGLEFFENIRVAMDPKKFEKVGINLAGSILKDGVLLEEILKDNTGTAQSKFLKASIGNPSGQGTTDVIIKLPDNKALNIDVKYTKGGYGTHTQFYNYQDLVDSKSKALTDEDRLLFKQLAYLIVNTIHITGGDIDLTDQLLSPLLTLLFTTDEFLDKLVPTDSSEITKAPHLVAYQKKVFWFSFLLQSIITTYFGESMAKLGYYTLNIQLNKSESISSEDFIKLKRKTVKDKYSKINYVDRLENLLTDPTLEPHFAAFQSMVNSISIKAYSSIKLKDK